MNHKNMQDQQPAGTPGKLSDAVDYRQFYDRDTYLFSTVHDRFTK
jgi:hypothetical protein